MGQASQRKYNTNQGLVKVWLCSSVPAQVQHELGFLSVKSLVKEIWNRTHAWWYIAEKQKVRSLLRTNEHSVFLSSISVADERLGNLGCVSEGQFYQVLYMN